MRRLVSPALLRRRTLRDEVIAQADDYRDANGLDVLTFADAQRAAARWHDERLRAELGVSDPSKPYTVADACADYLAWYREHRKALAATKSALELHILPELGRLDASKLTSRQIRDWHEALAASPRRTRAKTGRRGPERRTRRPGTTTRSAPVAPPPTAS